CGWVPCVGFGVEMSAGAARTPESWMRHKCGKINRRCNRWRCRPAEGPRAGARGAWGPKQRSWIENGTRTAFLSRWLGKLTWGVASPYGGAWTHRRHGAAARDGPTGARTGTGANVSSVVGFWERLWFVLEAWQRRHPFLHGFM